MRVELKGVHRVRSKLADGTAREYHYAWRGGPKYWDSKSKVQIGSSAYLAALADCAPKAAAGKFREIILLYLSSAEFKTLSPRYQKDLRTCISHPDNGVDGQYGDYPNAAFGDRRIRGLVKKWQDSIGGKVGDDRMRCLQKIAYWGYDNGKLTDYHLRDMKTFYRADRSQVIWTDGEIQKFIAGAPKHIGRILLAATETGLRPGSLHKLSRFHVKGDRIEYRTEKRNRVASIPITPKMAGLIADTPSAQPVFLCTERGRQFRHENYLGDAISTWRDRLKLRRELRLYDARGTAVTRLLEADATMKEIATVTGWSVKHAGEVVDHYAALHPDAATEIGRKLATARGDS